jgi:hypothetical protein
VSYDAAAFLESLFRTPMATKTPAPTAAPGVNPADLPADWHVLWDERAAIMEYDGGLPREHAEAEALSAILRQMEQAGVSIPTNRPEASS